MLKKDFGFLTLWFLFLHQMTPLHLAAEGAHIKIVEYLVDQEADVNIEDDNGVNICIHTYQNTDKIS